MVGKVIWTDLALYDCLFSLTGESLSSREENFRLGRVDFKFRQFVRLGKGPE